MKENNEIKSLLMEFRLKAGLSQRKMASKIVISHSTLNDIENGKIKKVSINIIIKLAEKFDMNIKTLLKAAGYEKLIYLLENNNNF